MAYADVILAEPALVAYWPLDEWLGTSAGDAKGHAAGTYTGGVTLAQAGPQAGDDTAAAFDGASGYVAATPAPPASLSAPFTVEAWAAMSAATGTLGIFSARNGGDYSVDLKVQGGNTVHADIGTGAAWLTTGADYVGFSYVVGLWYHLALVVTATAWAIYIDGIQLATGSLAGTALLWDGAHTVRIGSTSSTYPEWFAGSLARVAVYNAALSAAQLATHYAAGSAALPTRPGPAYRAEISLQAPTAGMWTLGNGALGASTTLGSPYGAPSYQSIPGLRSVAIKRGRQDELGTIQPGTCEVRLDNAGGSLSPDNVASPFYPNIVPLRRLRVTALWKGVVYPLFQGFIESYAPIDNSPVDADMLVRAVDWLGKPAQRQLMTANFPAQDDGARVTAVLGAINTAGAATAIEAGVSGLVASTLTDVAPQQHLADVVTSARGLFFVAADGTLTYHNRQHRFLAPRSATVQARFGQPDPATGAYAPGVLPFVDPLQYVLDDRYLYNDIRVSASGAGEADQVKTDTLSQQVYLQNVLKIDASLLGPLQAVHMAEFLILRYAQPYPRIQALELDGDADTDGTLWATLLSLEIADRVHLQKARPGSMSFERDCWVEGVEHDILLDQAGHTARFELSDCRTLGPVPWVLGTSALGASSGPTTVLAY